MRRTCAGLALLALSLGCGERREKLIAQLQSPRPEERAAAVRHLAEQKNSEDLVFFTRAAQDLSGTVRAEAATALGTSQDPRVVDLLGALLEDSDEDVQGKAATALAQFPSERSKQYLTSQYARRGRSTRAAIVQALKASNVPGAMATVVAAEAKAIWDRDVRALTDGTLAEQAAAAEELGKSGRSDAVQKLEPLARQGQVILAAAAARGLGDSADPHEVPQVALLLNENSPELREASIEALAKLRDPVALARLTAVALERSAASEAAARAVASLPRTTDSDQSLCQIALEGADAQAFEAGRAMRDRGGCPLPPFLKKLPSVKSHAHLGGSSLQNALEALRAVEGLGPSAKDALPQVLGVLADPDVNVRGRAFAAAAAIGDASAAPQIAKAFADEKARIDAVRADWVPNPLPLQYAAGFEPAVTRLAQAPGPDDKQAMRVATLLNAVDATHTLEAQKAGKVLREVKAPAEIFDDASDVDMVALAHAVRALAALKADGAQAAIAPLAQDPLSSLRTAAFAGLASLGKDGIALAAKGLYDTDRDVQASTAAALVSAGEPGVHAVLDAIGKLLSDRTHLLLALEGSPLPSDAVPTLVARLRAGGPESAVAAHLLGEMKAKSAIPELEKVLDDAFAAAHREAIWALGEIGDRSAAEVIGRDLFGENPEIRLAAVEALAKVGGPSQIEAIDALKGDYYRSVRAAADKTLARLSTPTGEGRK
jgi:HEAT repeat protein